MGGRRAASTVRRLAREAGIPSGDMLVLDEYNHPSPGSTGPHVHVGFNTEAAAMRVPRVPELDESPTDVPPATASVFLAGATPSLDAGGTGSLNAPAQSPGAPGASRNGGALAVASARQASHAAAAPVIVANLGPPPPAAGPPVQTAYAVPIITNPHNPDQVLRGIVSVGGGGYNA